MAKLRKMDPRFRGEDAVWGCPLAPKLHLGAALSPKLFFVSQVPDLPFVGLRWRSRTKRSFEDNRVAKCNLATRRNT